MLSQMDVALMKSHLMDHQAGINKLNAYLGQVRDPQLAQAIQLQQQTMQRHYQIMVNLLQNSGGTQYAMNQPVTQRSEFYV
ncbi:MAG: hypothetical protein VR67_19315 [Peptococcaceae bacterium BRH_c8a]|nr:MAG: hypothetical protein VR67_19315 [Peptococcaceae bacterium BRH_c8a]